MLAGSTASALGARLNRPGPRRALLVTGWLLAAASAVIQFEVSWHHRHVGLDFRPLYRAGQAVLHGQPIYHVPSFVYPPPAAVLGAVLAQWPVHLEIPAYIALELAVLIAIAVITTGWLVPPAWRAPVAGFAAAALVWSHPSNHSLWLSNISVSLAAVGLLVVWLFGRDHWLAGCLVLVLSLLVKPLLVPLVLIPLLRGRWRPLAVASGVGVLVLAVSCLITTGLGQIPRVVRLLLHGSVLVGAKAADNLSVNGFAEAHHWPSAVALPLRILVLALAAWVAWALVRRRPPLDLPGLACLASTLLLALLLAGTLSEVHYLFAALPGGVAAAAISRHRAVRAAVLLGVLATLYPVHRGTPIFHQELLVLAEVAFFVAGGLALLLLSQPVTADDAKPLAGAVR